MTPFKSIKGRALGKLLEGYKSSDIGKGFGSGSGGDVIKATGGTKIEDVNGYTYHVFNEFVAAPYMQFTANTDLTCEWWICSALSWWWCRWFKIIIRSWWTKPKSRTTNYHSSWNYMSSFDWCWGC